MKKEEIIKRLNYDMKNADFNWGKSCIVDIKDLKGLLDLYNKEKEKREIAEENHKVLSLDLGKALKELGLYEDTIIADELVLEIKKRYISKDKIREKMKYYKKRKQDLLELPDDCARSISLEDCDEKIAIYEELLEE